MGQGRRRHRPDLQGRGRLKRTVVSALALEQGDGESRRLLLGTAGTVALNVASVALNLAVVLLLTRLLGPDGFGAYASAYAWAVVLSVLAVLGLTPLVIRYVASYSSNGNWGLLRGLLRRTNQSVAIASAAIAASAALAGFLLYRQRPELLHPFWIGLPLVPLIALTSVRQAAMQGLGRVVLGRVPETLALPILLIALASSASLAFGDGFGASWAIASHVVAALCAFALGAHLLRRMLPPEARSTSLSFETAAWRRSGISLALLNVLMAGNAQAGTILLGAFEGAGDAGVFNVATRTTMFVSFLMLAATYPLIT
jgi:O-antigen/teichoic acid export membrane protein